MERMAFPPLKSDLGNPHTGPLTIEPADKESCRCRGSPLDPGGSRVTPSKLDLGPGLRKRVLRASTRTLGCRRLFMVSRSGSIRWCRCRTYERHCRWLCPSHGPRREDLTIRRQQKTRGREASQAHGDPYRHRSALLVCFLPCPYSKHRKGGGTANLHILPPSLMIGVVQALRGVAYEQSRSSHPNPGAKSVDFCLLFKAPAHASFLP